MIPSKFFNSYTKVILYYSRHRFFFWDRVLDRSPSPIWAGLSIRFLKIKTRQSYSGLTAAGLAFAFWLTIVLRRDGTSFWTMVSWFSARRVKALFADIRVHLDAMVRLRVPPSEHDSALASAVHGLGLLLMTVMAGTGLAYYVVVGLGLHSSEPDDMLVT